MMWLTNSKLFGCRIRRVHSQPGTSTNVRTHSTIATNRAATASAAIHEITSRDMSNFSMSASSG